MARTPDKIDYAAVRAKAAAMYDAAIKAGTHSTKANNRCDQCGAWGEIFYITLARVRLCEACTPPETRERMLGRR